MEGGFRGHRASKSPEITRADHLKATPCYDQKSGWVLFSFIAKSCYIICSMEKTERKIDNTKSFETFKKWLIFIIIFILTNPEKEVQRLLYKNVKVSIAEIGFPEIRMSKQDTGNIDEEYLAQNTKDFLETIEGENNQEIKKKVTELENQATLPYIIAYIIEVTYFRGYYADDKNHIPNTAYLKVATKYIKQKPEVFNQTETILREKLAYYKDQEYTRRRLEEVMNILRK